jgi:hypothetical protein
VCGLLVFIGRVPAVAVLPQVVTILPQASEGCAELRNQQVGGCVAFDQGCAAFYLLWRRGCAGDRE